MVLVYGNYALPSVQSVSDCIDYTATVAPYLPEVLKVPGYALEVARGSKGELSLLDLYITTNPLVTALTIALILAPIFLVVSEIFRNVSQVDRCWSIIPTIYNVHYAYWAWLNALPQGRSFLLASVSIVWSIRLTYNYWRRGGYQWGSEDYRWEIVKKYTGTLGLFIFNVLFISTAQMGLLVGVSLPAYVLLLTSCVQSSLVATDYIWAGMILVLIGCEYAADQQQWNFQTAKYKYRETAKVPTDCGFTAQQLDLGFRTTGMFAHSRHPNFAFEQSVWLAVYFWSCQLPETIYNWSGIGVLAYLILFQTSTWFTEYITVDKYPEYKEYQKRVPMFVPVPFSKHDSGDLRKGKVTVRAGSKKKQ